jgi:RNA recognition motif. (a.k.a. RRM, RBD, or RNP domain)
VDGDASLYVAFSTLQGTLRLFFDQGAVVCGGALRAVHMVMGKRPDGHVPKSFAFTEFDSRDMARAVLQQMQGRMPNGHPLQLKLSTKKGVSTQRSKVCFSCKEHILARMRYLSGLR